MDIFSTIISFIMIIIILYSYYYVIQLKSCPCFMEEKKDELNLQYIQFFLILDLFSVIIVLFLTNNKKFIGGRSKKQFNMITTLSILLVIFIHSYMSYNVYYFYKSVKENCSCVNKWQKYFIYYKGVLSSIVSLNFIFAFLFILYTLLNN